MAVDLKTGNDDTFWLPEEICVAFRVANLALARQNADRLLAWLNWAIGQFLGQPPTPRDALVLPSALQSPLARDLDWRELQRRFPNGNPLSNQPRSDVGLPQQDDDTAGTLLLFIRFADADQPPANGRDHVRQLVNLINWELLDWSGVRIGTPLPGPGAVPDNVLAGCVLLAATPNWLTALNGNGGSGDSPGAKPKEAADGDHHIEFTLPSDAAGEFDGQGDDLLVAVLDTCPGIEQVAAAAGRPQAGSNGLLRTLAGEIGGQFHIDEQPPSLPLADLARLGDLQVNLRNHNAAGRPRAPGHSYRHADHGLFVAGIIRDVAPNAEIDLIRVLNDFGVGDLDALAAVISKLPRLQEERGKAHLIVNLSLGAEAWPGYHLLHYWLPKAYDALVRLGLKGALKSDVERALAGYPAILGLLLLSHFSLALAIRYVVCSGALVVAAAGNDYDDQHNDVKVKPRQEPRLPARYERVLGVAAVAVNGSPATYSNRGDGPDYNNGVATFGGQAHRRNAGELPEIEDGDTGIVGICSAEDLPLDPGGAGKTKNGWMMWAGTSFSTPIISGLSARYWSTAAHTGEANGTVLDAIRNLGSTSSSDLSTPVITAHQTP